MTGTIRSVEEFYAHALAIEQEAAERYSEFEVWYGDRGEEVLAGLARTLSRMEARHHAELVAASKGLVLPPLGGGYSWLGTEGPEAAAREALYRVACPRQLLELALAAERRALAFFEEASRTSPDPAVRALALEMADEERQHVRWVRDALEYHAPFVAEAERPAR